MLRRMEETQSRFQDAVARFDQALVTVSRSVSNVQE